EQILVNLLDNAVKYTDPGGEVWLTCVREGQEVIIRVWDTGIGIAPEMLPRIFDLFAQADHTLERARGGLGIGLTLIRNLVEMHGGTITASSAGLGKGSEFIVRLPVVTNAAAARSNPAKVLRRQFKPLRMLVVDDNVDATTSLAMLLRLHGHTVEMANDGSSALATAKSFRPQVAILDIGLPHMDGYELAHRLRGEAGLQNAILVAITGYGYEADRQRARKAGFDHHLVKPVDPEDLKRFVESISENVS